MKANENINNIVSLDDVTKGNVWDLQENDIIRLWQAAEKEQDILENARHYMDIIRSAFDMEELKLDKPEIVKKYEARGMKVSALPIGTMTNKWGIKKRPIVRVTDLTYENIRHISAAKLLEVIERNFGGGWDSLSQAIKDIILSGFDISTTTLPTDRLKKAGSMYEMKINDGFEVLEITKGSWSEAIFAKVKPLAEKVHDIDIDEEVLTKAGDEDNEEEYDIPEDDYNRPDEDDDDLDDDALTAESYRTTIEENPDDLDITVEDLDDEDY